MTEEEKFQIFHKYHRLARDEKVPFLYCKHCGCQLVTRLGKGDTCALWCMACNTLTYPGVELLDTVKARVSEWIL